MKTQFQNEKSQKIYLVHERDALVQCVGPDYSASLSHLFLLLKIMLGIDNYVSNMNITIHIGNLFWIRQYSFG